MDQISNVATQADYTDLLTLGPSNYDAINVNVWNNSCVSQTFELGPGGDYQTGQWGSESLEAANSTFQLGNCGGVRFKTNPDTPLTPAQIIAYAWKSGDVQKLGGIQLSGTINASGSVTPGPIVTAPNRFGVPGGPNNVGVTGANGALLIPLWSSSPYNMNNVYFRVNVQSGNIDVGLYDASFNKIVTQGGAGCPAAGQHSTTLVGVIPSGPSWLAISNDNGTARFAGFDGTTATGGYGLSTPGASYPLPATLAGLVPAAATIALVAA